MHRPFLPRMAGSALLALVMGLGAPLDAFCADAAPGPAATNFADSGAASSAPVTLKDSVAELMRSHDRIKAAEAAFKSTENQLARAKGVWYPRLNAQVDAGREDINRHESDMTTGMYRNVSTLSANQLLYDFGGARGGIDQAKGQMDEARARLEQARQEVAMQGVAAYLGLIRAREMLRYAIRSEENIKRLSGMQEALVERGMGLSYEELQIKAQLAGAEAHRVNQERAMTAARNNYRSVFQRDVANAEIDRMVLPAAPRTLPGNLDEAVEKALDANPALVEMQAAVRTHEGDLTARNSAMYPKLEAVAEAQRKENDQGEAGLRNEGRAGFQITYNLFQGFRDVENTSAAKNDILAARKSLLDRRRTVEERVRNAWSDMSTLKTTVGLYENQANITWSFLELVKRKKALGGDVGILDILVGERDYITSTSSKVGADIDLITAGYTLLYQMGQLRPEAVEN